MPWKATVAMKERTNLVLEWERRWHEAQGGRINMAQLCRMFGVSRETGCKWVARYRESNFDLGAVVEHSKRPKSSPNALSPALQDLIVEARKRWPRWGPRKLHRKLVDCNPGKRVPGPSVIAKVLKQRGMTVPRKKRRTRKAMQVSAPFAGCDAPNAVWCIDFKGWFRTANGVTCYPLTIIDAYSRHLLRCEALLDPDGKHVQDVLDSAFQEFGLPVAIRSDGGPPFASTGPALLTELSVWLVRLGIRVEIIAPSKPQQNGRLERLHRTLKAETASPPERDCRAQQRRFDVWRYEYNFDRPHEALKMSTPASIYTRSRRVYPCPLLRIEPEPFSHVVRVDKSGYIKWNRRKVFISSALRHEDLEIDPVDDGWEVRWSNILIGQLDENRPERGLVASRRPRGTVVMSLQP